MKPNFLSAMLLIAIAIFCSQCKDKDPEPAEFSIDQNSYDFGKTDALSTISQTFTISNTGGSPLEITSVSLSGTNAEEFSTDAIETTIAAGASYAFDINYAPTTGGDKSASLTINDNLGTHSIALTGQSIAIYVAGDTQNAYGNRVATVWLNGEATSLSDGFQKAYALSVYVEGSDVYVAGHEYNSSSKIVAKIWKNGEATELTDGTTNGFASSICVVGSDVYVAGYEYYESTGETIGKVWKNGVIIIQSSDPENAHFNSIAISGNDIYTAGYNYDSSIGKTKAVVWKNGINTELTNGTTNGCAYSVYISGNDVYVSGYEAHYSTNIHLAKFWKNGSVITLGGNDNSQYSRAESIYVSGTDVYVAGENGNIAKFWKNGEATELTDGAFSSFAYDICTSETDIYTVGTEREDGVSIAKIWKNGIETKLTDGTYPGVARAIFIVE